MNFHRAAWINELAVPKPMMDHRSHSLELCRFRFNATATARGCLVGLCSAFVAHGALAQTMPATAPDAPLVKADPTSISRTPLLREGSEVLEATARVALDNERGTWTATLASPESGEPGRTMTLLPCARLSEIQRQLQSASSSSARFRLSGEVYVFRGQNYLLPTQAQLIELEETSVGEPTAASAA